MGNLIDKKTAIENMAKAIWHYPNELYPTLNCYENARTLAEYGLKDVPSAEPEIIMCRDCKWKQGSECVRFAEVRPFPDDFCSRAERKENR